MYFRRSKVNDLCFLKVAKALGFLPNVPWGTPKAGRLSVCCRISRIELFRHAVCTTIDDSSNLWTLFVEERSGFLWVLKYANMRPVFLQMLLQSSSRVGPTSQMWDMKESEPYKNTKTPFPPCTLYHRDIFTTKPLIQHSADDFALADAPDSLGGILSGT